MVGVSVVLLMMVLLVVGCTVEVVDTDEVVDEVFDEVNLVRVVELIATAKVVDDIDEIDIINGRDIIDGVVNTVDVSDSNNKSTDDIRTEDVESLVILIPVITAGGLVVQLSKVANSHAYSVKLLPAGMLSIHSIKFN